MKTLFKVAAFQLGDHLLGVWIFLGFISINLGGQYLMQSEAVPSTITVNGSFLIVACAGFRSMERFAFFQSWHLPRKQFFLATAGALLAMAVITMFLGPALEAVFGNALHFEYTSIAEGWPAFDADEAAWSYVWSFSLKLLGLFALWLLQGLYFRGWLWQSLMPVSGLIGLAMLRDHLAGVTLDSTIVTAGQFFFGGIVDGARNVITATTNLALAALLCASACYLALRRTPIG